jgi:hypothetical protein
VAFDANVFLLKKDTAERLLAPAPAPAPSPSGGDGSIMIPPESPKGVGGDPIPPPARALVTVRLSGEVPPEQWNKIGIKLIPKLRSTNGLHIEVVISGNLDGASASNFVDEINQAIDDLGLQTKLHVKCE